MKLQRAACAPLNPAGCPIQFPQPAPSSVEKTNKPISLWEKAAHKQVSKSQQRLVSASDSPGVVQDLHYRNRPDRCDLFFSGLGSGSAPPVTFTPHPTPAGSDYLAALSGRQCLVMWLLIVPFLQKALAHLATNQLWPQNNITVFPLSFALICFILMSINPTLKYNIKLWYHDGIPPINTIY